MPDAKKKDKYCDRQNKKNTKKCNVTKKTNSQSNNLSKKRQCAAKIRNWVK